MPATRPCPSATPDRPPILGSHAARQTPSRHIPPSASLSAIRRPATSLPTHTTRHTPTSHVPANHVPANHTPVSRIPAGRTAPGCVASVSPLQAASRPTASGRALPGRASRPTAVAIAPVSAICRSRARRCGCGRPGPVLSLPYMFRRRDSVSGRGRADPHGSAGEGGGATPVRPRLRTRHNSTQELVVPANARRFAGLRFEDRQDLAVPAGGLLATRFDSGSVRTRRSGGGEGTFGSPRGGGVAACRSAGWGLPPGSVRCRREARRPVGHLGQGGGRTPGAHMGDIAGCPVRSRRAGLLTGAVGPAAGPVVVPPKRRGSPAEPEAGHRRTTARSGPPRWRGGSRIGATAPLWWIRSERLHGAACLRVEDTPADQLLGQFCR